MLDRVLSTAHCPFFPRDSAAAAAAERSESGSPARSLSLSRKSTQSVSSARTFWAKVV
jgi:hypothetical protein